VTSGPRDGYTQDCAQSTNNYGLKITCRMQRLCGKFVLFSRGRFPFDVINRTSKTWRFINRESRPWRLVIRPGLTAWAPSATRPGPATVAFPPTEPHIAGGSVPSGKASLARNGWAYLRAPPHGATSPTSNPPAFEQKYGWGPRKICHQQAGMV
jgi:hypothetical protein